MTAAALEDATTKAHEAAIQLEQAKRDLALAAEAEAYRDRRLAQAAAGELAVVVDHADLLVLP